MGKIKDISGNVYGLWTVISYHGKKKWLCRCACGTVRPVERKGITKGGSRSCGCTRPLPSAKTHGDSGSKEYQAWCGMKDRCYNVNTAQYKDWGGRGIVVCDRWVNSYPNFLSDMGRAPSKKHSIERNNVDGNYEPDNCRWATVFEQANKRSVKKFEYNGKSQSLSMWCVELGLPPKAIKDRIYYQKWDLHRAFTQPVNMNMSRAAKKAMDAYNLNRAQKK